MFVGTAFLGVRMCPFCIGGWGCLVPSVLALLAHPATRRHLLGYQGGAALSTFFIPLWAMGTRSPLPAGVRICTFLPLSRSPRLLSVCRSAAVLRCVLTLRLVECEYVCVPVKNNRGPFC